MFAAKSKIIHANCKFDKTLVQFQPPPQNYYKKLKKIKIMRTIINIKRKKKD